MKNIYKILAIVIVTYCLGSVKLMSSKNLEPSAYPTVFLVMREYTQKLDWYQILRSALHRWDDAVDGSPILHIPYKHVCIVDEGDAWAILFFTLNNGRTSTGPGFYDFAEEDHVFKDSPNFIVYLDKNTLKEIPVPENGIDSLPILSVDMLPDDSIFFQEMKKYTTESNRE
jgi:hypothetical protein